MADRPDFTLRPARTDDLPVIMAARKTTFADHHKLLPQVFSDDHNATTDEALIKALLNLGDTSGVLVAEINGTLVGYVIVFWMTGLRRRGHPAEIFDIWVAPDHRRHGIGQALKDAAIAFADREGACELTAQVWAKRAASLALFEGPGRNEHMRKFGIALSTPKVPAPSRRNTRRIGWDGWLILLLGLPIALMAFLSWWTR